MNYVLYTFQSSSQAMKAEMLLENNNIKCRLVPLLPKIDAGCGLALRFSISFYKQVDALFLKDEFIYQNRYIVSYSENRRKPEVREYDLS